MALFQQSVLKKHLNDLNKEQLQQAWSRFTIHFHDPVKQQNIRNAKEEQYQEGFLRELFVDVLGYTLNPSPGFNLTTEYKNEKDSKKADGAILKAENVTAVIELKGTDTTDLGKVETQAFSYKNNQKGCTYVITSNFEKLRFYINDAVDHAEFNLFTLTEKEFAVLYCCLQADALLNDTALKMKQASVTVEENVTKQLYADYSGFKRKLFQSIAILNTQYDQLTLFKKTQKLLDRFLFILFAEDRLLVPPNSVREILKDWENLNEMDNYVPLYDRFKKYFGYLNNGHEGKKYEIFAYNGGLFAADDILDNIKVEDALLFDATKQLSQYDFETEVDVNILGHIFEHSLTEIEEVERELTGAVISPVPTSSGTKEISPEASDAAETSTAKKTSKRKKDGVFYTPRYITKYIVENTVGALCNAKKEELEITDDAFTPQRRKDNTKKLQQKLETYRQWLLQLTICDPACGSGAFLNQALEFLITEHRYVDTLTAKLFGDTMVLSDVENSILENNLFGVDINEEAVEIARLSLWLRTARKGRKLNNLSNNIKVGNSLIDDPAVAGDKAFNWKNEFASIFEKGGFDVVIGNPPYVNSKGEMHEVATKKYWNAFYKTAVYQIDTYLLFVELSLKLINKQGLLSLIIPNAWLNNVFLSPIRSYILNNSAIISLTKTPNNTFADANVDTVILTLKQVQSSNVSSFFNLTPNSLDKIGEKVQTSFLNDNNYFITYRGSDELEGVISKVNRDSIKLSEILSIARGVGLYHKRVGHTKEFIEQDPFFSEVKKDETFVPYLRGKNIFRYEVVWDNDSFISYGNWLAEPREIKYFEGERILLRQIPGPKNLYCTYIDKKFIVDQSIFIGRNESNEFNTRFLCAIVNSRLIAWYFRNLYSEFDELFPKVKLAQFKDFPIKKPDTKTELAVINSVDQILTATKELQILKDSFLHFVRNKFNGISTNKKLHYWYDMGFGEFLKELEKQKIKLSLAEQSEWMSYFEAEKAKANQLQQLIDATDIEIDRMVYALYELTEEEIKIVEGEI